MVFKFTELSLDLALEIIHFAAAIELQDDTGSYSRARPYYRTALSLAAVSYGMRAATMPHLLRTVVLYTRRDHATFTSSVRLQQDLAKEGSRLALDYKRLVQRLWSSGCFGPVMNELPQRRLDYGTLSQVIRGVGSLGLTADSLSILDDLSSPAGEALETAWSAKRVTFAGPFWRWNPLTSTEEGLGFLRQITHLTLWITDIQRSSGEQGVIPAWVHQVPFPCMPQLTHFAFPLARNPVEHQSSSGGQTEMVVYTIPPGTDSYIMKRWLVGPDPLAHGTIISLQFPGQSCITSDCFWESLYVQGAAEKTWTLAEEGRGRRIAEVQEG